MYAITGKLSLSQANIDLIATPIGSKTTYSSTQRGLRVMRRRSLDGHVSILVDIVSGSGRVVYASLVYARNHEDVATVVAVCLSVRLKCLG